MSADAIGYVFRRSPFKGVTFAVHLAMADSVNDLGGYEFWMRQGKLAVKARCSRQAANEAIARILKAGFIELVEERPGGANRYRFIEADTPVVFDPRSDGVSPKTTTRGVAADDNGVAQNDSGVSPQTTEGVAVDDTEPKGTQGATQAESGGEPPSVALQLCNVLASKVAEHRKTPAPRVTSGWVKDMDLLLRRGAPQWSTPQPQSEERVRRGIEWLFSIGTIKSGASGFCWADQVRSASALRDHWDQIMQAARAAREARQNPGGQRADGGAVAPRLG